MYVLHRNIQLTFPPAERNPMHWDCADVLRWLKEQGFEEFQARFQASAIIGSQLMVMHPSFLKVLFQKKKKKIYIFLSEKF